MNCPKCGQVSDDLTTCSKCGIIFKKYISIEDRQREIEYERWDQRQQRLKQFKIMAAAFIAASLAFFGFYSFNSEPEAHQASNRHVPTAKEQAEATIAQRLGKGYYMWDSGSRSFIAGDNPDPVKHAARKIIRLKQTRSGYSTLGFLITKRCHAIVGTYLTKTPSYSERISQNANEHNDQKYLVKLEEAEAIFEKHRKAFVESCNDCSQSAFDSALKRYAKKVDDLKEIIDTNNRRGNVYGSENVSNPYFIVTTDSGSFEATLVESSQKYNLSLVLVNTSVCEYLDIGNPDGLNKADPVYAYEDEKSSRLNRGVFDGFTGDLSREPMLTHNIELKPGTSGTPILNETGEVIAVSIAPRGGVPQAIPIDSALRILKMPL